MGTADIRPTTDVVQVIDGAVRQGLRDQGLRRSSIASRAAWWSKCATCRTTPPAASSPPVFTRATLKARASRPDDTFEQVYWSEKEERVLVVPTEASDAAQINHCPG
jgi:hypothetical protein